MQLDTGGADPLLLDWAQGLQMLCRIQSTALIQRRPDRDQSAVYVCALVYVDAIMVNGKW